jgi:P-type Ca2+ transporter type 2C
MDADWWLVPYVHTLCLAMIQRTSHRASTPLWTLAPDDALRALGSNPGGIAEADAVRRRNKAGPNRLPEAKARSRLALFAAQFTSLLILLLLAAAVLAWLVGDIKDAVVIAVVVLFNACLGFVQEHRAEAAVAALRRMLNPIARVRRSGQERIIPAEELVPGDIVLLEAGDRIPADGRFVIAHALEVDESSLTGESVPAVKNQAALEQRDVPVGDRTNIGFMNTAVTRGRAEMLVYATGPATEMGRLAGLLEASSMVDTPLQRQINGLARRLAIVAGVAVAIIAALQLMRGVALSTVVMEAVAIAVAAIPEGLPAVVTVTLAIGMRRMARDRAIVKRMSSVETLGSTTDICSDKTGTLTLNQMTVRRVVTDCGQAAITGQGYRAAGEIHGGKGRALHKLLEAAALCNDSTVDDGEVVGDPTEGALWVLAAKGGADVAGLRRANPRVGEVPFEAERKFSATLHRDGTLFVKGAPDVVLERCTDILGEAGARSLSSGDRERLQRANEEMAAAGLRVLAVATRRVRASAEPSDGLIDSVASLTFLGLVGMLDPPRTEVREAIAVCRKAGISVRMITGDHPGTGLAIARALGIPGETISGREIDQLDDAALAERMPLLGVLARVSPEHKLRAVTALRLRGRVVAMIGDGINDAPALKRADIGVAMGVTGTEVTKEAATLILSDDNFSTIVGAIREGRTIYNNIVRFLRFQLSTNLGALLTILAAPLMGLPLPFTPLQILWVNLIMDGPPAMALGVDPPHPSVMDRPPRDPNERLLTLRRFAVLGFLGAVMAVGTLGLLTWGLSALAPAKATTLAFTTFVLFQLFNVFNARLERSSALSRHSFTNRWLWMALAGVLLLQIAVVHAPPLQTIFDTADLTPAQWCLATGIASSILVLDEVRKLALRSRPWRAATANRRDSISQSAPEVA